MIVDRAFIYGVSGLLTACGYVAITLLKQRRFPENELGSVITCFLAGPGMVAAVWLIREGLMPSAQMRTLDGIDELRLYLVVGGVGVGWVSLVTVLKEWRSALVGRTTAREAEKTVSSDSVLR